MFTVHILTLFGESIRPYLDMSIMKRAQEKGLFRYYIHNLTDWTVRNTRRVDDRPYGGWAWTIISIEPLVNALEDLRERYGEMHSIFLSPRGKILTQEYFEWVEKEWHTQYCIICGHYEWIDARIFEFFDIEEVSLGEYVLSSGELASLVWIDGIVRLIPGVLSEESLKEESFSKELWRQKEYPQYSRPEEFRGKKVPDVLLSGDKKKIQIWKMEQINKKT